MHPTRGLQPWHWSYLLGSILILAGSSAGGQDLPCDDIWLVPEWVQEPSGPTSTLPAREDTCGNARAAVADDFGFLGQPMAALGWWGRTGGDPVEAFAVRFYDDAGGAPGVLLQDILVTEFETHPGGADRVLHCAELYSEVEGSSDRLWLEITALGCGAPDWEWATAEPRYPEYAGAYRGDSEEGIPFWTPISSDMAFYVMVLCDLPPTRCCRPDGTCVVRECGAPCQPDEVEVPFCEMCEPTPIEETTWSALKRSYR